MSEDPADSYLVGSFNDTILIKSDKRRWAVLWIYFYFAGSIQMAWIAYSPILKQSEIYYNASLYDIIQLENVYPFVYFGLSFLGAWAIGKWFRVTTIIAMLFNCSGAWIRYFAKDSYFWAFVGQTFGAISQNATLMAPPQIAATWFPRHERTLCTVIAGFSGYIGSCFGFVFPTFIVQNSDPDSLATTIPQLMFYEAIITSVPIIPALLWLKDKPTSHASVASMVQAKDPEHFLTSFMKIVKNGPVMLSIIAFATCTGLSWAITSVIQDFLPADYTQLQVGLTGLFFLGAGVIAGTIGTVFLVKNATFEHYDVILKIFIAASLVSTILLALFLASASESVVMMLNAVAGIGMIGFYPFAFQSLVESTFPIPEALTANFLLFLANGIQILGDDLSTAGWVGNGGFWVLSAILAPCVIYVLFFFKTKYKRKEIEDRSTVIQPKSIKDSSMQ
jgi:hypothetical protein